MALGVGDPAPGFELPSSPSDTVDVAALIGRDKVVLLFVPAAFSGVCTAELCRVRADWEQWQQLDARVFAVCVDSPFVTGKFRELEALPFPVLSDFNKEVTAVYGVLGDLRALRGVPKRSAFVIDRNGRIAYRWVSEDAGVEPDYGEIRAAVETAA